MESSHDPSISNILGFLSRFEPSSLDALRRHFDDPEGLQEGQTLGPLMLPMRIRVAVSLKALSVMTESADRAIDRLLRKARLENIWETAGQLVTLVGSGGALAAIFGGSNVITQAGGVAAALTASAIALCVKAARKDITGTGKGALRNFADLVDANGRAVALRNRLLPYEQSSDDLGDIKQLQKLIAQSDELAGDLYRLLKFAGAHR